MMPWVEDLRGEIAASCHVHVEAALTAGIAPDDIEACVIGVLLERLSASVSRIDPYIVARAIGHQLDQDHPGWKAPRRQRA